MRKLSFAVLLAFAVGCTPFAFLRPTDKDAPPQPVPPVEKLLAYLNNNSERVHSVRYEDITLTPTIQSGVGPQSINLSGMMVLQKPRNFRMQASLSGNSFVDLGSNDQEFWWWIADIKKNPTYQYYCSYRDLEEGRARKINIPLQPEWVIEVLGLGTYGPKEKYTVEPTKDTVRLIEKARMNGKDVRKVIVFQRRPKQPPDPMVSDFELLDDATGKLICSAHISEVHLDYTLTNAYLPRKVEINCPEMKAKLALKMNHLTVNPGETHIGLNNQPIPNPGQPIPLQAFVRQPMSNIASRNLAFDPVSPAQADGGR